MRLLSSFIFFSIVFGQGDYSLEDINPSSDYYGDNVGTSYFEGKITLHYFGHFYWGTCATRFGQLNDLYDDYKAQGQPVELIGIGKDTHLSSLSNWTNNNNAPVCAEESPFTTWTNWGAAQRDLFVLDQDGNVVLEQNITAGLPNNLEILISDLLGPDIMPCEIDTIYINEVNNSGGSNNYIEIFNSDSTDCSLEGFSLGNSTDPLNFSFENVILQAGQFWLGYEGQDSSFSAEINSVADTIILSDSNNNLISVEIGESQELEGISLSQSFNEEGIGCYTSPSPGAINNACLVLSNEEYNIVPEQVTLYQNYPNPFNPLTTIKYKLSKNAKVNMDIFDSNGKLVSNLFQGNQKAGIKSLTWNGTNSLGQKVSTGIYIYRLLVDETFFTKKMIFLK